MIFHILVYPTKNVYLFNLTSYTFIVTNLHIMYIYCLCSLCTSSRLTKLLYDHEACIIHREDTIHQLGPYLSRIHIDESYLIILLILTISYYWVRTDWDALGQATIHEFHLARKQAAIYCSVFLMLKYKYFRLFYHANIIAYKI